MQSKKDNHITYQSQVMLQCCKLQKTWEKKKKGVEIIIFR